VDIIHKLLQDVPLPRLVKIHQHFPSTEIGNILEEVQSALVIPGVGDSIRPGMRIAIAIGSRGIADIAAIAKATVNQLKQRGAEPFVVPAMGSHGGATAEGQKEVLAGLGVTEESMGCLILSSMDVVELGRLKNGLPVLIDKHAYEADGIVVINRVKPHTAFRGPSESGLVKILTIGLGKQKGADSCHSYGFGKMAEHILAMAKIILDNSKVLFGIGIVENAYERTARIVGVPATEIMAIDRQLLIEAKANMPRILFDQIDVLIVDRMGKEFSGDGMDPNITGRYPTPFATGGPDVNKIVVLDLTEQTHGNANGIGGANFTTRRLLNKIDYQATYANALTANITVQVHLPVIMENDRDAILAAIKTCNARDLRQARVVRITDTLHLGELYISEAMLEEAGQSSAITICSEPQAMQFDSAGNLIE